MTMSSEPMLIAEPPQDAPVATVTTTTKSTLKMPADGADITLMNGVEHNFGTLEGNPGKLKYRFDFVNNGNEPLVISKVTFSCKCMKVVAPMRPVKPGESAYIDITYDVEKNLEGRFSKLVTLYSNSAQPRIVFVLHGVIAPEIK